MKYKMYSKIRLTTDRYKDNGVGKGTCGIIMNIYDETSFEVHFLDNKGETSNIYFAVTEKDIELV
ncbi:MULTISPECIES: hypothetical protein [unclassified Breznakia]|uniref:DUF4926 domain-containing protein n=1 Tax=unclassified Breznakia TaxID=2623764 RepID=UPI002476DCBD|nr:MULTISPECIES: hypothetical protein [unclassified Breznakia]MDH6366687.1 hypothetical protein [Breznakia sp. PH1-1]MDH6403780.1 hypothetical protein [Breznakia sp. PF1-11]MDH6411489.1 hypothetical protein [Breznakia sp. PFB1-11]MDH6413780.1 hypothetical protein [Breznakia sp. PFB1-14]MDH6416210.1 hypothetical protein [Breznakia sp. PFB1-4]